VGVFDNTGIPGQLIEALREHGATNLVVVSNGAGSGDYALGGLIKDGRVRKLIASFPAPVATTFRDRYLKGAVRRIRNSQAP
jgi:3-oxoadipate CoA-transferase alpha subunit